MTARKQGGRRFATTTRALSGRVLTLSPVSRYAVASASAVVAVAIRLSFDPVWGQGLPFITMFPAVVLAAWLGGFWPGIVTTMMCAAAAQYFWLLPAYSWAIADTSDVIGLVLFVTIGIVISALNEGWRRGAKSVLVAQAHLRIALEAGRMGTWEYAIQTGTVKWSPGLEAIHGLPPGSFPGTFQAFRDEIHLEDRERVLQAIGTALEQRRDHHVEYRIVRADGAVRWVEGVGQVVAGEDGRPERMVGVCTDITDRRLIEEERAQLLVREQAARAEVERASRLKDEFLAILSHELRTPLNAVLGYAHLLNSGRLSAERTSHAIAAIQRNAQAQTRLVESLLDLSRIMAGKLELNHERLDLSAVMEAAVDVVRPDADAKGVTLDVVLPSEGVTLIGDGGRLQQVCWNLLSNAIKFTPAGGKIGIALKVSGEDAIITVADTGQGIRPDFLPYVFDRFKQGETHTNHPTVGLGLGLALVREMVQAHVGTVDAESPGEGYGSTFTVTLPLSFAAAQAEPSDGTSAPALQTATGSLTSLTALVVDDDGDARDLLTLLLESRGASVRAVSSATEAIGAIGVQKPDVLLADIRMPNEDGYSLIRKVRARERTQGAARVPAIAVSAYASAADRERALAAGYDGHVAKPIDTELLIRAIVKVAVIEKT